MKKILLLLSCIFTLTSLAQNKVPKWLKEARKASFSIISYDAKDNILHHGNGFFISKDGVAMADLTLFKDASRATIVTYKGKEYPIQEILGVSEMYDAIKFKVATTKKVNHLTLAKEGTPKGTFVYLLPYATYKKKDCESGKVIEVSTLPKDTHYYTIGIPFHEKKVSNALLNAKGEVIALLQRDNSGGEKQSFALGTDFVNQLSISALDANNKLLNTLKFTIGLPENQEQALLYTYMKASSLDSKAYLQLLNQYIAKYPTSVEGYLRRASQYIYSFRDEAHISLADEDLKTAEKLSEKKEDVYFTRAKLVMDHLTLKPKVDYTAWDFTYALAENEKALKLDSLPAYMQQRAQLFFVQKKYNEAYTWFEKVQHTKLASADNTYSMAKSKELAGGEASTVLALMDSVIQQIPQPSPSKMASYYIERANLYMQNKAYKKAFFDYNAFYKAMHGQVSDAFYFYREQAAIQFRHYKQAIEDIDKAIALSPKNSIYLIEGGSIYLRIGKSDKALTYLNRALELEEKSTDALRLIGLCYIQKKEHKKAFNYFQKAIDLGDELSKTLLEKYNK